MSAQKNTPPSNPIDACVRDNLEAFFRDLDGQEPHSMHEMLIKLVEKPLFEIVMREAGGNQSKAAQWLGINRNTLRRKLTDHNLL
ncbi:MAG: helix-turn-helix domain-containing protein [Roseateles sp.]